MRRNHTSVYLHFVWATWDRLPSIPDPFRADLKRYIASVCRDDGCQLIAFHAMPNHIHILVSFSNTLTFADFMKHVKGGSSRHVSEWTGSYFRWQEGYGVFSVSANDLHRVIAYIDNQRTHHVDAEYDNEVEHLERTQ